jgi:hypothetical protein
MTTAGSPGDPHGASSSKRPQLRASFVGASLITLCLWIGAPTSASAASRASCSGLDAACVTQSVRDDVAEITRAAGDGAREAGGEVDDTVDGAIDAVERVVGAAASTGIPAPGGGPEDRPGGRDDGGGRPKTRGNDEMTGRPDRSRAALGASRAIVAPTLQTSVRSGPSVAHEGASDESGGTGTDGGLGIGRIAADIGRRLALPLALLLALVAAFVVMQGRLDRTDPKLHLASLDDEVSRFR